MKAYPEYKASGISWLDNIPSHWKTVKAKYLFSLNSGDTITSEELASNGIYPVFGGNGIRGYHNEYNLEGEHIVIGRVGALCGNVHYTPEKSRVTEHALIVSEIRPLCRHWLGSLLEIMNLRQYSNASAQPVIASSVVGNLLLPVPPLDEQEAIAKFLDAKTALIDALISEKRKQVEDIRTYRSSLITETVTCGLNHDAPLRPSGIDWVGNIPSHWEALKMKNCIEISNGSDPKTEGFIPVYGSGLYSFKTCGEYKEGPTVLIARKGTLGIPNWIDGKYWNVDTAFDTKAKDNYNLRFFYYVACSFDYEEYKSQTTLPSMTQTAYEDAYIPVPPLFEQEAIAAFLDAKTAKIDELIAEIEMQIADLETYRKAVITEAVTGKVDVRNI